MVWIYDNFFKKIWIGKEKKNYLFHLEKNPKSVKPFLVLSRKMF